MRVAAAGVFLASFVLVAVASAARPEPKPNILFVLADDIGYGDLGCYGQRQIQTPNLDRLAAQGMRFTQFYAGAPVCAPSRSVLMTGQHTGHTRIRGNDKVDLLPQDVTVAQVLHAAGYATGLVGKWGLGAEGGAGSPVHKGFDYFYGYVDQTMAHNYYPTYLVENDRRVPLRNVVPNPGKYGQGVATVRLDYSADLMADRAASFIRAHRGEPFFLDFSTTLPHANDERKPDGMEVPDYGPYGGKPWPAPEKGFAAMITRLDTQVGRLLAELDELGLSDHTIVIFASDNGPHSEGGHNAAFFDSSGPLRGIKRDVYEGGIREPMIVRWPGRVAPGSVSNHIGYFGDFMATAAEIAGGSAPEPIDSISFLPTLLGRAQPEHAYLYWEFYEKGSSQAVRLGDWKAVRIPMLTGPIQLYDLVRDLGERHDVAAEHPDVVARIRAIMGREHVASPLWKIEGRETAGQPTTKDR